MSCPVNFDTVKNGIVNKASEMLQQSGVFSISNNIAKVINENLDYNKIIEDINKAFNEQIIKKTESIQQAQNITPTYSIEPSNELINKYLEAAPKKIQVKEGIQELFDSNPELASIGTQEQYSQYLDTIFPDSKVKDIVYHQGKEDFEKFDLSKSIESPVIYFSYYKPTSNIFGDKIKSLIVNFKNPYVEEDSLQYDSLEQPYKDKFVTEGYDAIITPNDIGIAFEPEQVHILGSKQDIEGFKNFIASKKTIFTEKDFDKHIDEENKTLLLNFKEKLPIPNIIDFTEKDEHHVTVIPFSIGRIIKNQDQSVWNKIKELIKNTNFKIRLLNDIYSISKEKGKERSIKDINGDNINQKNLSIQLQDEETDYLSILENYKDILNSEKIQRLNVGNLSVNDEFYNININGSRFKSEETLEKERQILKDDSKDFVQSIDVNNINTNPLTRDTEVVLIIKPLAQELNKVLEIENFIKDYADVLEKEEIIIDSYKISQHYKQFKDESFFSDLLEYYTGKTATVYKLKINESNIKYIRDKIGHSSNFINDKTTLRYKLVGDKFFEIKDKFGVIDNGIHFSDSKSEGSREAKIWFDAPEIFTSNKDAKIAHMFLWSKLKDVDKNVTFSGGTLDGTEIESKPTDLDYRIIVDEKDMDSVLQKILTTIPGSVLDKKGIDESSNKEYIKLEYEFKGGKADIAIVPREGYSGRISGNHLAALMSDSWKEKVREEKNKYYEEYKKAKEQYGKESSEASLAKRKYEDIKEKFRRQVYEWFGTSKIARDIDEQYKVSTIGNKELNNYLDYIKSLFPEDFIRIVRAPLKSKKSLQLKADTKLRGRVYKARDIARATLVINPNIEDESLKTIFDELKKNFYHFKVDDYFKNPKFGYKGINIDILTNDDGVIELQINTPEMIYLKETKEISQQILGDDLFKNLENYYEKTGGLGHLIYDLIKLSSLNKKNNLVETLKKLSLLYYNGKNQTQVIKELFGIVRKNFLTKDQRELNKTYNSIIQKVDIENIDEFYKNLSQILNVELTDPFPHVTLSLKEKDTLGISIPSEEEFNNLNPKKLDIENRSQQVLASGSELTPEEIITNVINGFKLYKTEGFGVPFKSRNEKASRQLAKNINSWLEKKGWNNKVKFAYEAVYGTVNAITITNKGFFTPLRGIEDRTVKEKYFKNSRTRSTKDLLKDISKSDHPLSPLASKLLEYSDLINIPIELVDTNNLYDENVAYHTTLGSVHAIYNPDAKYILIAEKAPFIGHGVEPTILHEIIHSYTSALLDSDNILRKDLEKVYDYIKSLKVFSEETYALSNIHEFTTAFFTNSEFIKTLQNIPSTNKFSNYKNLWEQLLDYFMQLFGFSVKEKSIYSEVYGLMTNIIDEGVRFQNFQNQSLDKFYKDQDLFAEEIEGIEETDWDAAWEYANNKSNDSFIVHASATLDNPSTIQYSTLYPEALPSTFERQRKGNFRSNEVSKMSLDKIFRRLQKVFPDLKIQFISPGSLNQSEHAFPIDQINSFVKGDTVYLVEGKFDTETAIEEFLHPFVLSIQNSNEELFNNLFDSAIQNHKDIYNFYLPKVGELAAKAEVITKALTNGVIKSKDPSLYEKFISFLKKTFQAIFPFSKDSIKLTSKFDPKLTIEDLSNLLINGGFNFQTEYSENPYYNATDGSKWVEDQYDRLKTYFEQQGVVKVGSSEGYQKNGKKIGRITDLANKAVRDFFKNKKQLTQEQEAFREIAADEGSNIHAVIESILEKYIDKTTGLLRSIPNNPDQNTTNLSDSFYKKLHDVIKNRIDYYTNIYGKETRFLFEQIVYNHKKNLAGTVDFIAITPDKKIHIRDWKTTQREINPAWLEDKNQPKYIKTSKQPFKIWKRIGWDTQLGEYREAIINTLGVPSSIFTVVRIDPILTEWNDNNQLVNITTPSPINKYSENRQTLPYVSKYEAIENQKLEKLFSNIREMLRIKLERESIERGYAYKYDYSLDVEIEKIIQDFYLFGKFESIFDLHKEMFLDLSGMLNNLKEIAVIDIDNAKDIWKYLSVAKEMGESLTSLIDGASSIYGTDFEKSNLTDSEKTPENIKKEKEFKKELESFATRVDRLNKQIKEQRDRLLTSFAEDIGEIKDFQALEKKVGAMSNLFSPSSTSQTKSSALLYKITKKVWPKISVLFRNQKEDLQNLQHDLTKKAQQEGKSFKESMLSLVNQKLGKLHSRFSPEFFKDRDEVLKSGNLKRIKAFFQEYYNMDELKEQYDKLMKEKLDEIEKANYFYLDLEDLNQQKKRKAASIKKRYDLNNSIDAYVEIRLDLLKQDEKFQDKYWTKEFKEITKNKQLFDLYNYIININKKAFQAGAIDYNQIYTFIPKMKKSIFEKGISALSPKEMVRSIADGMRVISDTQFGAVNAITGQLEKRHFIPYTEDIFQGDYSDMNFDLISVYSHFIEAVETGLAMKELIPFTDVLLDFESDKKVIPISTTGEKYINKKNPSIQIEGVKDDTNRKYLEMQIDALVYGKRVQKTFDKIFSVKETVQRTNPETGEKYEEEIVNYYSWMRLLNSGLGFIYKNTFGLNIMTPARQYLSSIGHSYFLSGRHFKAKEYIANERLLASFVNLAAKNKDITDVKALAIDYFMPYLDQEYRRQSHLLSTSAITKIFQPENLMFLMRKSTRMTQANIFMTILDNFIVVNGKIENVYDYVKELNKDKYKNVTNKRTLGEFAIEENKLVNKLKTENSIYKYLKVEKKTLQGKEINTLAIDGLNEEELRQKVIDYTQYYSKKATGENSQGDFYGFKAYMLGNIMGMYRNWIPRTVQARFGKFTYNGDIDSYEWGRWGAYASTFLQAGEESKLKVIKAALGFSSKEDLIKYATSKWYNIKEDLQRNNRELVDLEKVISEREFIDMYLENYRKTIQEFRMISGLLMVPLFGVMSPGPDDDDETKGLKAFISFQYERMYDEYSFYINPKSFTDILGNSIPAVTYVTTLMRATTNTFGQTYYWVTQNEKGMEKTKPLKFWLKSVPVASQMMKYYSLYDPEFAKSLGIRPYTVKNFIY